MNKFKVIVPKHEQENIFLRTGEKLVVKSFKGDVLILERPKTKESIVRETLGAWKDVENGEKYTAKIRKGWGKREKKLKIG